VGLEKSQTDIDAWGDCCALVRCGRRRSNQYQSRQHCVSSALLQHSSPCLGGGITVDRRAAPGHGARPHADPQVSILSCQTLIPAPRLRRWTAAPRPKPPPSLRTKAAAGARGNAQIISWRGEVKRANNIMAE